MYDFAYQKRIYDIERFLSAKEINLKLKQGVKNLLCRAKL
jgi:hypothetical protein